MAAAKRATIRTQRGNLEPINLARLIDEVIGTAGQLAEKNQNRLVVEAQENLGALTADSMRLKQILLNLLSNACKFTKEGEVRLRVRKVADGRGWVELAVADSGIGMTAEDGEKGCAMAVSERPDIILMDLEMPVVNGWKATRRLKGNPQTRDIPIIALSAHALAGEREKALAAGCNEFDTKPIEFDRLVATIRRVLANPK